MFSDSNCKMTNGYILGNHLLRSCHIRTFIVYRTCRPGPVHAVYVHDRNNIPCTRACTARSMGFKSENLGANPWSAQKGHSRILYGGRAFPRKRDFRIRIMYFHSVTHILMVIRRDTHTYVKVLSIIYNFQHTFS